MIKFFRHIRQRLLTENKFSKYLLYAIGEIILVVIGILIALQINNWNENRIKRQQLISVYERITVDIQNDIEEMSKTLEYFNSIEFIFKRVINDSITPDLFDVGLSRILTGRPIATNLNTTGVNQLKELDIKDSLSLNIIDIYSYMERTMINNYEKRINNESAEIVNDFRDNYDWYPEYMSKNIMQNNSSKELQDYFLNSTEYRHRVIGNYQLIYVNYVGKLQDLIPALEKMKKDLKNSIDKEPND